MRIVNRFFIAAAASIVAAASPSSVFAHARMAPAPAHIIRLGDGNVGDVKVAGGISLGGVSRSTHAQRNRNATPFAGLPFDWSYGSYTIVAPPPASGFIPVMMRASTPVAELPRCHESFGSVSIVRGKSCRT